jgi:GNAT superfamily N-acetyltransferase
MNPKLISDYAENEELRVGFNRLTELVFGFSLEEWYQREYWSKNYIPYSYLVDGHIIANVSIYKMKFVLDGQIRNAIQFSTVMTHPDYTGQGLSRKLMEHVLEKYNNECDMFFLFANDTVLDYYQKFGFEQVDEYQFELDVKEIKPKENNLAKLDMSKDEDLKHIYDAGKNRIAVSDRFGVVDAAGLLIFHCMYLHREDVYYSKEEDAIVIYKKKDNEIHLYDIVSKYEVDIKKLLGMIVDDDVEKIIFHFTPDKYDLPFETIPVAKDERIFVKQNIFNMDTKFIHPHSCEA